MCCIPIRVDLRLTCAVSVDRLFRPPALPLLLLRLCCVCPLSSVEGISGGSVQRCFPAGTLFQEPMLAAGSIGRAQMVFWVSQQLFERRLLGSCRARDVELSR